MSRIFKYYGVLFPYILFINVASFGTKILGFGTVIFMLFLFALMSISLMFSDRLKIHIPIFLGLLSFFLINLFKALFYNSSGVSFSFLQGSVGVWLIFVINFVLSALFFKNSENKMKFVTVLSYTFMLSSFIGIIHYYLFYNIPFIDTSYAADGGDTIFNVADYDLMRFRESSIFFGANVNAYMTVMGYLFLVFSLIGDGIVKMFRSPIYWIGLILHCWNIFISDSRSGIILITIFTLILLYDKKLGANVKIPVWAKVSIITLLLGAVAVYIKFQPRLQPSVLLADERFIKIYIGATILLSSLINLLIGAPANDKWTLGDVTVSDNMYIALLLYVGVIGMIILAWTTIFIFKKLKKHLQLNTDYRYNLLAKYMLMLFLLVGVFSIAIGMMPFMIYLGIILGGVNYANS